MQETENKFEQLMNTYLDEKIWNSEILYYVSMIHEQKVRCEYLELQNPKLFQRLAKINEYEIIEGFANELGISSIRIKKIFNNKDCWIATQSATARNDGNGMDWIATQSATARNDDLSTREILKAEYKYVLFPYAYVTNQGEVIAQKWQQIDSEAKFFISKYFNISIG